MFYNLQLFSTIFLYCLTLCTVDFDGINYSFKKMQKKGDLRGRLSCGKIGKGDLGGCRGHLL